MNDDTLTKRKPLHHEDAKAQNNHNTVIVLGRIYGRNHLLSSERLLNIYQMSGIVKNKFLFFIQSQIICLCVLFSQISFRLSAKDRLSGST